MWARKELTQKAISQILLLAILLRRKITKQQQQQQSAGRQALAIVCWLFIA